MKKSHYSVLYVEDDKDDQDIFKEVLKAVSPEFHCYIANDGHHALDILKTIDPPTCIYVDVNMPRMNGLEFLKAIKLHPIFSAIPIFVLTTSASANDKLTATSLGAKQYIIKPNSYSDLFNILEKCCEPYRAIPEAKIES